MNVICVIGDLVDSKRSLNRGALQGKFQAILEDVNRASNQHLASPCTITLGDEYQAVYKDADTLFQDFWAILAKLHPNRIRFSVGIGPLYTPINAKQALGMDGPAFHAARAGLDNEFKQSGRLFRIQHTQKGVPGWIEAALALVSHEVVSWKFNRYQIFQQHLLKRNPKEIAENMSITPNAVYKNIHAGCLDPIGQITWEVKDWINSEVQV